MRAGSTARIYGARESAAGGKTVKFEKESGIAQWVRVSVDGHSADIIGPHGDSGELGELTTGEWIIVRVEVRGNPSDKAGISVDGGSPDKIVVTIPPNDNANNGSQPVLVL